MTPLFTLLFALAALAQFCHGATVDAHFTSAASIPVTAAGYTAAGNEVHLTLSFAPSPGTHLTVVKNTGLAFIAGRFGNLAHGETVTLTHAGVAYPFVANYYGGNGRSLVLHWPCTGIAAWGSNQYRQLGNGGISDQAEPVAVMTGGVLAGKTVVGIAAGQFHSVAVTADGRAFGWGNNHMSTQVPSPPGNRSPEPVAVDPGGVLAGKTLVAVTAGGSSSLALAADGTAYSWVSPESPVAVDPNGVLAGKSLAAVAAGHSHNLGLNSEGQVVAWGSSSFALGNNSPDGSTVPVAVDTSGVLAGKTLTAIAAGYHFSLAASVDGQVFSWGLNDRGQLGNNSTTLSMVPVAVTSSGALAGETITAVAAGFEHGLALSADGKVFAWGSNGAGQLGNGTTTGSLVPVAIDAGGVLAGKTVVAISAGAANSTVTTDDGMIYRWGATGQGNSTVPVLVTLAGDFAGRQVQAISAGNGHHLALLDLGPPTVERQPANQVAAAGATVTFTAAAGTEYPASIRWQVSETGPAGPFADVAGNPTAATGTLELPAVDQAQHGSAYRAVLTNPSGSRTTAAATLTLVEWTATFAAATDVPFQGDHLVVSGPLQLQLAFAPRPGTHLTVINNTGTDFINGRFSNVPQGGTVPLEFNGVTYPYIANYFGGNGRSLVLQWPLTRMVAWGGNSNGQLGNDTTTDSLLPVAVATSAALAGKTVIKVAAGSSVSMALTADGRLFAWGRGINGQLGLGGTSDSRVPAEVTASGALAGKTVVSMSIGANHCLALTDEGQVYAWGLGDGGQLGVGSYIYKVLIPTPVDTSGALAGQKVVAISAGSQFSLALTAEGRVLAWGDCHSGKLGNGISVGAAYSPMAIITREELADRSLVAISAGQHHSLAMAADGKLFAWGNNGNGQLGNNNTGNRMAPTAVIMDGALAGKCVSSITTGWHNLVLTTDGQAYGWGSNFYGQLGNGTTVGSRVPVAVHRDGVLAGKSLAALASGSALVLGITTDGQCVAWGLNDSGQLGNGTTTNSPLPVAVTTTGAFADLKGIEPAASFGHSLVLADAGPPMVTVPPFNRTAAVGATVSFTAAASHPFGFALRWQVSTTGPAGPFADITDNPTATTGTLTLDTVTAAHATHAYRAVFSNISGSATTAAAGVTIADWSASLTSTSAVPFRAAGVVASGVMDLQLGFVPPAGADLMLIENIGTEFISGTFANLPHGGRVSLAYQEITYDFIANYYGGNGRSLVLQWPWTGLAAWGANSSGQLGTGNTTLSKVPAPVFTAGKLSGKTVSACAAGYDHSLAVTSDGRVFSWGNNTLGQLGAGIGSTRGAPVEVGGELAGKTVVAVAAGTYHSAALTADGRVYAWGSNFAGGLGNGGTADSSSPVPVDTSGALAGKSVVAIAAGKYHTIALTSDGGLYAWGWGDALGDGKNANSSVPVAVDQTGVLAGKTVIAIAAGGTHNLALTADGKVFAWGRDTWGELGNGGIWSKGVPVAVDAGGALAGKIVVAIAAGANHSMALTADGLVVAWGYNSNGQLGDGTTTRRSVPVAVLASGVLAGSAVTAIAAGNDHSLAATADGRVVTWGHNWSGQLGDGSTVESSVPVAVDQSGVLAGTTVRSVTAGASHSLALFPRAALPVVTHQPLSRTLFPGSNPVVSVSFTAAAVDVFPPAIQWQESATGSAGPFSDIVGNPSATADTLIVDNVTLASHGHAFRAVFSNSREAVASVPATLAVVAVADPVSFAAETDLPLSGDNPVVVGSLAITLGFAPVPGTDLVVLKNTGSSFIIGTFDNLPQGATVPLTYDGMTHDYVVDYFGGNGRSLVLHWPRTRLVAWGNNAAGQLGNNSTSTSRLPALVDATGPLAGITVTAVAAGNSHSLALTADGLIWAWGANGSGQLGNGGPATSLVPVAVDVSGALAGKTVVGIAAGDAHSLAVTADGLVYSWGANTYGRLGNGSTKNSAVPVAVDFSGGLAGKTVVAVAAGNSHSLALTAEGRVFAWGLNNAGQLGITGVTGSTTPVEVTATGALSGQTVIAIAAGTSHSLALAADGRVYAWGANFTGQLGTGTSSSAFAPVAVSTAGVLAGKTVIGIAAGFGHSMAVTSDGKAFGWGKGDAGQLGNNSSSNNSLPVAVVTSGVLAGKSVTGLAAGFNHCLTIASDGRVYAWGDNQATQLGDNSFTYYSASPVAVYTASGALGTRKTLAVAGGGSHSLAIAGAGYPPAVATPPENRTTSAGATVTLTADATGLPAPTVRWQVSATGSAGPFSNLSTSNPSVTTKTLTLAAVTATQHGSAYRAVFTNAEGAATTSAATLTVLPPPELTLPANLTVPATTQAGATVSYGVSATDSIDGPLLPHCEPPSGTVFPLGTTTVTCTATNSLGGVAVGTFTVTVQRTFAAFQDQYEVAGGPGADPHHTGLANLVCYAFGTDPAAPDRSQLPVASFTDGYLQISYPRWQDTADLSYVVEVSDDLQTWHSGPDHVQTVSVTVIGASRVRVVERAATPVADGRLRFIRVRLVQ